VVFVPIKNGIKTTLVAIVTAGHSHTEVTGGDEPRSGAKYRAYEVLKALDTNKKAPQIAIAAWQEAFYDKETELQEDADAEERKKERKTIFQAFTRAKDQLAAEKRITTSKGKVWRTER
jgi:hypothetical protein